MKNRSIRVELVSRFYRKNHCAFFTALFGAILSGTTGLIVSWILKEIIDILSGQSCFTLLQILLVCVGFIGLDIILTIIQYVSEPRFIRRAMSQYKDKAFSFLSAKNISSFRDETTSTYLSALTNDATAIENGYVGQILPIVSKSVTFFGSLLLMLIYSPILTGFAILIMVIPSVVAAIMGKKMQKAQKEVSDRNSAFTAAISDCLAGFSVIKSFRAENEVQKIYESENGKLEDAKCRLRKISVVAGSLGLISGALAQLGVFLIGAYLVQSGSGLTAGAVLMFVNLMNFLIQPVSELPRLLAGKKAAGALIDKLADSLSQNSAETAGEKADAVSEAIEFKNVSFSYDGEKDVLHDIDCRFESGKSYAIVGGSGSGKSTFLNLLLSGSSDYQGNITIDGKELRSISTDSLYDLMTVIQQNVFVFNASIRDNVTMFRDFSDDKVEDALSKAHLLELIRERGDDYLCGENGKGLSGGEKQRVSIARSLLKESSILLADEVTSALDAKTSHEVINEILDLDSVTRIVVTHSLEESLLKRYDEILVIRDGTIEEMGSFDSLMEKDGYFKALFTIQQPAASYS